MSEFLQGASLVIAYRAFTIACGVIVIWLGYKLFRIGVYEKAGELKAAWGASHLSLKQAAPGTFFALFGALIIGTSVWKGIDLLHEGTRMPMAQSDSPLQPPSPATSTELPSWPGPVKKASAAATPVAPSVDFMVGAMTTRMPDSTKKIVEKASQGKTLSETERKELTSWLERQMRVEEKTHYIADMPKGQVEQRMKELGLPSHDLVNG